jgi:hypothetical protein
VDELWSKLISGGGEPSMCGWLKDKFGLSWQIIPTVLTELLTDKDPAKAKRVMEAMLQMTKIEIPKLKAACARAEIVKHGRRIANVRVIAWQADPGKPVAAGVGNFLV